MVVVRFTTSCLETLSANSFYLFIYVLEVDGQKGRSPIKDIRAMQNKYKLRHARE